MCPLSIWSPWPCFKKVKFGSLQFQKYIKQLLIPLTSSRQCFPKPLELRQGCVSPEAPALGGNALVWQANHGHSWRSVRRWMSQLQHRQKYGIEKQLWHSSIWYSPTQHHTLYHVSALKAAQRPPTPGNIYCNCAYFSSSWQQGKTKDNWSQSWQDLDTTTGFCFICCLQSHQLLQML